MSMLRAWLLHPILMPGEAPVPTHPGYSSAPVGSWASPTLQELSCPGTKIVVGSRTGDIGLMSWSAMCFTGGDASVSSSEALLPGRDGTYGVYVQIKQTDQADRTDEILDSLRVNLR